MSFMNEGVCTYAPKTEKKDMIPPNGDMVDLLKTAKKKQEEYWEQYEEMKKQFFGLRDDIAKDLSDITGLRFMGGADDKGIYFHAYLEHKKIVDMNRVAKVLEKYDFKCVLDSTGALTLTFIVKGVQYGGY